MKSTFNLLFFLFGTSAVFSQVVPNVDWVRNYSEKDQIENVPSAIDANNNVYITGYSVFNGTRDFTTIKYDGNGTQQWVQHYNNIVGGDDRSNAIVIDATGNIYVTGQSQGTGTGLDYATVKYNASGVQQWSVRYNGAANGDDIAVALIVDNNGNVFVTGKSKGTSTMDYATVKYNSSGVQQWVSRYNGTGGGDDNAVAIGIGSGNRVYVTGTSKSSANSNDIVTIRHNFNTGNQMWVSSTNGTANGTDQGFGLLVDGNNVVICGAVENTGNNQDYLISKLNGNNGNTIFQSTYNGYGSADIATSIALDTQGDYVVTGTCRNISSIEYHTIKFSSSGTQQWVNKKVINQAFTQVNPKVATDFVDHIYVCGEVNISNNIDMLLYQITPNGNTTWTETHNGTNNGNDVAVDLVMGNLGVIYLAGQTSNSNAKFDYTTIKYSQTPVVFPPDFNSEEAGTLNFVENRGQLLDMNMQFISNNEISYYSQYTYPNLFFKRDKFSALFSRFDTIPATEDTLHRIDFKLIEANPNTKIYSFEPKEEIINYFIGEDANGHTDIHPSKRLLIPNIYPNIDLHYYSNAKGLKAYFVVKPGGDPSKIKIELEGELSSSISGSDELIVNSILESMKFDEPTAYQINPSLNIVPVATADWNYSSGKYGITLGTFNPVFPLIIQIDLGNHVAAQIPNSIDNICYSSYIGGSKLDGMIDVKIDRDGAPLFCGYSRSANFPVGPGSIITSNPTFLTLGTFGRMHNVTLGSYYFTSYFGGTTTNGNQIHTVCNSIDYDFQNHLIVTGYTSVNNMPTANLVGSNFFQGSNNSTSNQALDMFLVKTAFLSNQLYYSSYWGGSHDDYGRYLKTKSFVHTTDIYITGTTKSPDFPLKLQSNGFFETDGEGFLLHLNQNFDTLWTTRIESVPWAVDIDDDNNVFITGYAWQNFIDFPIANPGGGAYVDSTTNGSFDMFVSKFDVGHNLTWSTFLGGSGLDEAWDLKCKDSVIAISGNSFSSNFSPMTNVGGYFENTPAGLEDAAVLKFTTNGNYIWSTLYGGNDHDYGNAVVLANNHDVFLLGHTYSTAFTMDLINHPGSYYDNSTLLSDGFVAMFRNSNNSLVWSTLLGGTSFDFNTGFQVTGSGDAILAAAMKDNYQLVTVGETTSNTQFPIAQCSGCYADSVIGGVTTAFNVDKDGFFTIFCVEDFYLGVDDINSSNNGLILYPNPNSGTFVLELSDYNSKIVDFQIFDILGKNIMNNVNSNGGNRIEIKLDNLSKGVYIVQVNTNDKSLFKKFIVE